MGQTNHETGHTAEQHAADYLYISGYKIVDINWKNRVCEIDIIAQKDKTIYFVEVKYRKNNQQGSGLEYITSKKLKQMQFAAECWIQENNWKGQYTLSAAEMTGNYEVTSFLPNIL